MPKCPWTKLIIRFDDVSPSMAWSKFLPLKRTLEEIGIRSVLGVVPDCKDPKLCVEEERPDFFDLVREWQKFGDTIAQHGTHHVYTTNETGLLGINHYSEFAGHSEATQMHLLEVGKTRLEAEGVWQPYFMAPAHSFDAVTLKCLKLNGFWACTDGYGFAPYRREGIVLVPQLASKPFNVGFGVATVCLHINNMSKSQLAELRDNILINKDRFIDFKSALITPSNSHALHIGLRAATKISLNALRNTKKMWMK
jgi:predicted deacetylase